MRKEFKKMKFFVNKDKALINKICDELKTQGYNVHKWGYQEDIDVMITYAEGLLDTYCYCSNPEQIFKGLKDYEEINVDWMRTPQQETIELNGKKYIKLELEEALKHINPVEED